MPERRSKTMSGLEFMALPLPALCKSHFDIQHLIQLGKVKNVYKLYEINFRYTLRDHGAL